MFSRRLTSSIVLWAILLSVIFYFGPLASALLCCFVAMIALGEFYDMLKQSGLPCSKPLGLIGGVFLSGGAWFYSVYHRDFTNTFEVVLLICLVAGLFLRQLIVNHNGTSSISTISNTLLGVIYVPLLFNFIPKINLLYPGDYDGEKVLGRLFVFYLVVVTKFCDTGAYAVGRMFGRHKMIPRISPNKTWEGLLGGFVLSLIASVTAFKYLEPRIKLVGFDYLDAIFLGILIGIAGAVGDLGESLLKRETGVKDSGGVLPGLGGALDLIDSLLFTAPVLYIYLILFVHP